MDNDKVGRFSGRVFIVAQKLKFYINLGAQELLVNLIANPVVGRNTRLVRPSVCLSVQYWLLIRKQKAQDEEDRNWCEPSPGQE